LITGNLSVFFSMNDLCGSAFNPFHGTDHRCLMDVRKEPRKAISMKKCTIIAGWARLFVPTVSAGRRAQKAVPALRKTV
ncbi:MAG: hypothetical protein AB7S75_22655, partial [Desulfococcaceae bacterium]